MKKLKPGNKNAFGLKIPRKILSDSDGDGYPDPVDCEPNNPNKQGKVGDWLRKKGSEYRESRAYKQAASKQIKKKARAAGYRAEEKAAVKFAEEKAAYRGERRLAGYKQARPLQRKAPPRQGFSGKPPSMFGNQPSLMNPFGSPQQEPSTKKKPKRRKKKKQSKKGSTKNKKKRRKR